MSAIALTIHALLQSPLLAPIVGDRIYPVFLPQEAAQPAIVVRSISDTEEILLQGATQWPVGRVSIEIVSMQVNVALEAGEIVVDWLRDKDRYPMTLAGVDYEVEFTKEGTDVTDADEGTVARRIIDFYIRRRKA